MCISSVCVLLCGPSLITVKKKISQMCKVQQKENKCCMSSILTLASSGANVGDEASSAGVWLGRTLLAGVAPRSPNGCTTEGFSTDDSAELSLTHLVVYLGETWPSPVVCGRTEVKQLTVRNIWVDIPQKLSIHDKWCCGLIPGPLNGQYQPMPS